MSKAILYAKAIFFQACPKFLLKNWLLFSSLVEYEFELNCNEPHRKLNQNLNIMEWQTGMNLLKYNLNSGFWNFFQFFQTKLWKDSIQSLLTNIIFN